jgi:uncharacterized protein YjiS (DUF1127 family)
MGTKWHKSFKENDMNQRHDTVFSNSMMLIQHSGIWSIIRGWREVSRQRKALRELSDHQLKDIGISRTDAIREAGRGFWDDGPDFDVSLRKRGASDRMLDDSRARMHRCLQ